MIVKGSLIAIAVIIVYHIYVISASYIDIGLPGREGAGARELAAEGGVMRHGGPLCPGPDEPTQ